MITPTDLKLRREALGIYPDAVAALCGVSPEAIRRNERPTTLTVFPTHIAAIDKLEAWVSSKLPLVVLWIFERSISEPIGDRPVVWIYGDEAFDAYCPTGLSTSCLGIPSLYRLAAADAYSSLIGEGKNPIAAEMVPAKYEAFLREIGAHDTPINRLKWWRAWTAQVVVLEDRT